MSEPKPVMSDEDLARIWNEKGLATLGPILTAYSRRLLAEFAERVASRVFPCQGQECNRSTVWCPNCTKAAAVREAAKGADNG